MIDTDRADFALGTRLVAIRMTCDFFVKKSLISDVCSTPIATISVMSLVPTLERIEALDTASLEAGGIAMALADITKVNRFLDSMKVRLAQRAAEIANEGRGAPANETVREGCRSSAAEAARLASAAETAAATPALGEALDSGTIGLEHLGAFGAVARELDPSQQDRLKAALPKLLDDAEHQSPEQFRRALGAAAREIRADDGETVAEQRIKDRQARYGTSIETGMGWLSGRFDPETWSRMLTHLTAERDALLKADPSLTHEQAMADAITNLVLEQGRSKRPGITEAVVYVDLESLLHGAHLGGVAYLSNGTPLPVSHIRRLCCDAKILPMVLDGEGRPFDLGREQRLANREQRRALRKLHDTCGFGDCEVPFDECEVHHIDWWERHGPTDLANLAPVCPRHHHLVHEGGWRMSIDAQRNISVHRPDGTPWLTRTWQPPPGEHPQQPLDTLTRRRTSEPPGAERSAA